jgi:hypothetical protein
MIPLQVYVVQNDDLTSVTGRSCDGCVKCCDGTLSASIHGIEMGGTSKKPCHLVDLENKKCADYKGRPDLCKKFQCEWLVNDDIPLDLKPSLTDNTIAKYTAEDIPYLYIAHKGAKPNKKLLDWMIDYCLVKEINLAWWEEGNLKLRGTKQWVRIMKYTHRNV